MSTPVNFKDFNLTLSSDSNLDNPENTSSSSSTLGGAKRKTTSFIWNQQPNVGSGSLEDGNLSLEDAPDGLGARGLLGERLRPENVFDLRHGRGKGRDPLERRLADTVNFIFQKRKLEEARSIVSDLGISSGDTFSLQCGGEESCSIPATCCTTLLCRWFCCFCSKCISKSVNYEKLNKYLISKECTISVEAFIKELSIYAPSWLVNLYLHIQNPRLLPTTMLSREEVLTFKNNFFNIPKVPWIGIAPLLEAINIMRMTTEAATLIYEKQVKEPFWKFWPLFKRKINAVEQVSSCNFLEEKLTLELVAFWLLVLPTERENFSAKGAMRKIYSMLCATIAANMTLEPNMELDPIMVLGVLVSILKEHGVLLSPKDNLIKLAFDCNVGKAFPKISVEMQRRSLALLRRALNSHHNNWWDYFNSQIEEAVVSSKAVSEQQQEETSSNVGCAICCKKEITPLEKETESVPLNAIVTDQPGAVNLPLDLINLKLKLEKDYGLGPGLTIGLNTIDDRPRPMDEDEGQVSDGSSDDDSD